MVFHYICQLFLNELSTVHKRNYSKDFFSFLSRVFSIDFIVNWPCGQFRPEVARSYPHLSLFCPTICGHCCFLICAGYLNRTNCGPQVFFYFSLHNTQFFYKLNIVTVDINDIELIFFTILLSMQRIINNDMIKLTLIK